MSATSNKHKKYSPLTIYDLALWVTFILTLACAAAYFLVMGL